jgi:hypothetical protein
MKRFLILAAMLCGFATVGSNTSDAGWRYRSYYGGWGPYYGSYYYPSYGYGYYPYRSYYGGWGGGYYPYRSYYGGWGGGYYGRGWGGRRGGVWIGF